MSGTASAVADKPRAWLEMPVVSGGRDAADVRPKYAVETSALLIYRGSSVYVTPDAGDLEADVTLRPDVRVLTELEAREFENTLPFPLPAPAPQRGAGLGLGDLVHRVTRMFGLEECDSCRRRRRALNRVSLRRRPSR